MSATISRLSHHFRTQIKTPTPSPPPLTTLKDHVKTLSQEQDLTKLTQNFKQLSENRNFRGLHNGIYERTISRLAYAKQFSFIEDILEHHKSYDDVKKEGFNIRLIRLYGRAGMASHAHRLFDEMPERKCNRTVKSLGALIHAYIQSKKVLEAVKILREYSVCTWMKPDVHCYNLVIEGLCGKKEFDSAEELLDEMESIGVKPNVDAYNMLMNGFYCNGRLEDGDRVWERMVNSNVEPNVTSFKWKFKGLLHTGKIYGGVKLINELRSKDVESYISTYNILVRWYCNGGYLDEAKGVYDRMKKSDCIPNEGTYEALIACSCDNGDLDYALELCRESVSARFGFGLIDVKVLQTLVNLLVENLRVEEAEEIVKLAYTIHRKSWKLKMPST